MVYFVILYVGLLFAVAIYKSLQVKNQDDFMVAGRSVPTYLLIGTLICTWIGSGSLFAGAGLAFRNGISELWMSAGAWLGIIIVYFLAPRVRKLAQYTVSDILEKRYNKYARLLGTVAIIIAYMSIAGYQFRGGGRLLNIITGIDPYQGAVLTAMVVVLFTLLAGMLSIVSIDIFNGIIMTLGIIIALPLLLYKSGGVANVTQALPQYHFQTFGYMNFFWAMGVFFPTFFLLLGESSMYQKFFSAKSERSARQAVIGMVVGVVVIETVLALVAIVGSTFYHQNAVIAQTNQKKEIVGYIQVKGNLYHHNPVAVKMDAQGRVTHITNRQKQTLPLPQPLPTATVAKSKIDKQQVFMEMDAKGNLDYRKPVTETVILTLANSQLPWFAGALLIAAGVAIILSTANTFLMIPSTNIARDIYQRFINPDVSQKKIVWFQRIMIVFLGVTSFLLATRFETILDMAFYAYTMVGAGITPALLAAFLWKRVTPAGGVASIFAGIVTTIVAASLKLQINSVFPWWGNDYIIYPAAIASILCLIVVSLATSDPEQKYRDFFQTSE